MSKFDKMNEELTAIDVEGLTAIDVVSLIQHSKKKSEVYETSTAEF